LKGAEERLLPETKALHEHKKGGGGKGKKMSGKKRYRQINEQTNDIHEPEKKDSTTQSFQQS